MNVEKVIEDILTGFYDGLEYTLNDLIIFYTDDINGILKVVGIISLVSLSCYLAKLPTTIHPIAALISLVFVLIVFGVKVMKGESSEVWSTTLDSSGTNEDD